MTKTVYEAKYILAITDGNVTDQIRNNFINSVVEEEPTALGYFELLRAMAFAVMDKKNTDGYTTEMAVAEAKREYDALGLNEGIGSYETMKPFVDVLVGDRPGDLREDIGSMLDIADTVGHEGIKTGLYIVAVSRLVVFRVVTEYRALSDRALAYLDTVAGTQISGIVTTIVSRRYNVNQRR